MKIENNFLPISLANEIKETLSSDNFPWYYNSFTAGYGEKEKNCQFTHTFYKDGQISSNHYYLIRSVLHIAEKQFDFQITNLLRIKANLRYNELNFDLNSNMHQDSTDDGFKSLLYYVDDSDGNTLFFDNDKNITKEVSPEFNKMALFDSNIWHSASSPTLNNRRMVLNFIFS